MQTSPDQPHAPDNDDRDATCPDEILLAGWCDGLLDERELEAIDVHVSRCPRCSELVAQLRGDLDGTVGTTLPFAPQPTIDRAAALVLTARSWRFIAAGAAAIAAAIALAPVGLWIGHSLSESYASDRSLGAATQTVAQDDESTNESSSRFAYLDAGYEEASSDPFELIGLQLSDRSAL